MSNYIEIPDCDCNKKEVIIIDKKRKFKKDCGCVPLKEQHPKQRGVILACGTQVSDIIVESTTPVEIVRVAIDTSCLCNPLVTIDFCTIIEVPQDVSTNITITLSKECEGISKHPIAMFSFIGSGVGSGSTISSFCFDFCDFNNNCTGCCSYIVELTQSIGDAGSIISQGVVTANAQGACED